MNKIKILLSCGDEPELYVDALEKLGAEPTAKYLPDVDDGYDGLILCGGVDVDPKLYGEEIDGAVNIDYARDEVEYSLMKAYLKAGKPILGICRGHQLINVFFGGTLHQDIPDVALHRKEGETIVHSVDAVPDSIIGRLYGESFSVTSVHHQAIKALGDGLCVTADWNGVYAEAIEHTELPIFAVQWHPERSCFSRKREDAADGVEIFRHFIEMCKTYRD